MKKAVVLLSGGLDSSTVAAIAKDQGFDVYALSFDYDQRHKLELSAARRVAENIGVKQHVIAKIDLRVFGGSALTADIPVPKDSSDEGIPVTYVPARNTIFLSFGLAWAEVLGAKDIFLGVNALDYSGYPDCRPKYIAAYQTMANLATKAGGVTIRTPLISLSKAEIVRQGLRLGVDYSITSSCYDPTITDKACGHCDSCRLRLKGFAECGVKDPARYA